MENVDVLHCTYLINSFKEIISMEYYYHILAGALDYYLDMLKKIQRQVHCATDPTFAYFLALQKIIVTWSVLAS